MQEVKALFGVCLFFFNKSNKLLCLWFLLFFQEGKFD